MEVVGRAPTASSHVVGVIIVDDGEAAAPCLLRGDRGTVSELHLQLLLLDGLVAALCSLPYVGDDGGEGVASCELQVCTCSMAVSAASEESEELKKTSIGAVGGGKRHGSRSKLSST
jgi:hypothetical protein